MALNASNWTIWDSSPQPTQDAEFHTKFYRWGGVAVKKSVSKIYLTVKGVGGGVIKYKTSPDGAYLHFGNFSNTGSESIIEVNPNPLTFASSSLKNLEGIAFKVQLFNTHNATYPLTIDDISIVYRPYRDITTNED